MSAELLELAGNKAIERGDGLVSAKDVFDATVADDELLRMFLPEMTQLGQLQDPPPNLFEGGADSPLGFSDEALSAVCRHLNSRSNIALGSLGSDEELRADDLAAIKAFVHSMATQYIEHAAKGLKAELLVERGLYTAPLSKGVTPAAVNIRRSVLLDRAEVGAAETTGDETRVERTSRVSVVHILNRLRNGSLLGNSFHPLEFLEASVVNSIEILLTTAKMTIRDRVGAIGADGKSAVQLAIDLLTVPSLMPLRFNREAVEAAMARLPLVPNAVSKASYRSGFYEPIRDSDIGSASSSDHAVQQVFGFDRAFSVAERLLIDAGAAIGGLKVLIGPSDDKETRQRFETIVREIAQGRN